MVFLLYSCNITRNREKDDHLTKQATNSLFELKSNREHHAEVVMKQRDTLKRTRWLHINAEAPYRWHPDSGLFGQKGYLVMLEKEVREHQYQQQLKQDDQQSEIVVGKSEKTSVLTEKGKHKIKKALAFPGNTGFYISGMIMLLFLLYLSGRLWRSLGWYRLK